MTSTIPLKEIEAIILPSDCSPTEMHAAGELSKRIKQSTGLTINIEKRNDNIPRCCIVIGFHPCSISKFYDINIKELGDEGYWIKTIDARVMILGSKVRGALYGVYAFLERIIGVRYFAPEVTHVPATSPDLVIPELSSKETPAFPYRAITYLDAMDPEFSPTQRVNLNPFAEPDMGGSFKFSPGKMTHTFYALVPPGKYFKDHPEYFSLVNGNRLEALGQLCLTNPDVIRIATETVIKWFEEEPDIVSVGVVQNDWTNYCECEKCKAMNRGNPSRSLLHFCISIANTINGRFPGKFIHTIAYTYTDTPPEGWTEKLPDNLIVVVCNMYPYRSNRPMDADPMNAKYYKNLLGWLAIVPQVFVWHYFVDFTHYLLPYPIWDTITQDLRIYKKVGVKGVLLQAGIGVGIYQEFQELKWYVFHKLLWDPELDWKALVAEFVEKYYGPAAVPVQEFIDDLLLIESRDNVSLHLYVGLEGNHVDKPAATRWQGLLLQALELAGKDQTYVERVERVLICADYAYLLLPAEHVVNLGTIKPKDLEYRKPVLERFVKLAKKFKISSNGEQVPIAAFIDCQEIITKENSFLAIAELAPLVTRVLEALLDKVKKNVDKDGHFRENDYITTLLKHGLNPINAGAWMKAKLLTIYEPTVPDNWHRFLDQDKAHRLLHPDLPDVKRKELPGLVLGMIKGLPHQKDVLDDE
nr:DUF4838 domain-containing protein [Candidatus Sigynarchaeota archaeon]